MSKVEEDADSVIPAPSSLGTEEHWNNVYELELKNFEDHGDVGEVWFGEKTEKKMIQWLEENISNLQKKSILDVGCGNGHMLLQLSERKCENLCGVDYSQQGVDLAKAILYRSGHNNVILHQGDFLDIVFVTKLGKYDIILDKGTFDAISLRNDSAVALKLYITNLRHLMNPDSVFLISSCNWTKAELINYFSVESFSCTSFVKYAEFQFGGRVGSSVSTVAFALK